MNEEPVNIFVYATTSGKPVRYFVEVDWHSTEKPPSTTKTNRTLIGKYVGPVDQVQNISDACCEASSQNPERKIDARDLFTRITEAGFSKVNCDQR